MPGIDITSDTITFSQSWLGTAENCQQQALYELLGELPRSESDATAMGTACHAAVEAVVNGASLTDGEAVAIDTFHELIQQPEFQWVGIKTPETAERTIVRMYWTWANEVWPQLGTPIGTEIPFDVHLCTTDDGVNLRLKGSMDFVDELIDVSDWKFAALRNWSQRSADSKIQATAYLYALEQMYGEDPLRRFHFVVIDKQSQSHEIFTTARGKQDYAWLMDKAKRWADLIAANLPRWPLSPEGNALCSEKWCAAWDKCKGAITKVDT